MRCVVIGGGVGGLTAATRLADAGHLVTVLERNEVLGGKLAVRRRAGFTFDIGPSLVTLPHVFDHRVRDRLNLVRLDPQFAYHWSDGTEVVVNDAGTGNAHIPGWSALISRGERIWDVSERTFFAGPMSGPLSLMRRLRSPFDLAAIDPLRTLDALARRSFTDPKLRQVLNRYATYSGSSPYQAPATLACIPAIEARYGCWYPMGGFGALADALIGVANDAGVEMRTSAEAVGIDVSAGRVDGRVGSKSGSRVVGVRLASGERLTADVVVANVDAEILYRDLLPDVGALRKVRRAAPSTSGFVVVAGVRGRTLGIGHHNVWFSDDYPAEFAALAAGRFADDPTIYGCVSSVTDPSQAPDGDENWFLLVNAPPGGVVDEHAYSALVLNRLAANGVDLRGRTLFTETIAPAEFERRYRSAGGAIYGSSSNGRRAAFLRPGNRGAVPGLYLVGGSSHPGGGLPLVTMSARIVADLIAEDAR